MDQNILREYLIALGFKVDPVSQKKFGDGLTSMDKRATNLGRSLLGVAASTQAMVTIFASQMEKLYYSAKLANTSASQMMGIDFGAKQVGIKGMQDALITFASSLRANPGMVKLLEDLVGVPVKGLSTADQLKLLAAQLNKMPNYLANIYGAKFGLTPDMVFLLRDGGLERMQEQEERYAKLAAGLGVNLDEANKAGLVYAQTWRDIVAQVDLFQKLLVVHLLPEMQDLANYAQHILQSWAAILNMPRDKFIEDMKKGIGLSAPKDGVQLSEDAKKRLSDANREDKLGLAPEKSYKDMTDDERIASGKGFLDKPLLYGKPEVKPYWEHLSPSERRDLGLPATEADLPWYVRASNKARRLYEKPAEMLGLKSVNPEGSVELSSTAKERLGGSRLQSSAPTSLESWLSDMAASLGYESKRKTPVDQNAQAAVRAADPVAQQRDAKLRMHPEMRAQLEAALKKGDYTQATTIGANLDEMPDLPASALTAPPPTGSLAPVTAAPASSRAAAVQPEQRVFLDRLEEKYALPKGLLDRQWVAESGRGANKVGPLLKIDKEGHRLPAVDPVRSDRAIGDFQFTTPSAKQYSVNDRMDFQQSASGAAAYMADLVKKYADVRLAAAAYNWGPGKVDSLLAQTAERHQDWTQAKIDQYALGQMPKATQQYVEQVAGPSQPVQIEAKTTIHIDGSRDPAATGAAVAREQQTVNADLVRQFKQRIQ